MKQHQAQHEAGGAARASGDADPIAQNLRTIYDEVAAEPLPQHFLDLLARLEAAEKHDG